MIARRWFVAGVVLVMAFSCQLSGCGFGGKPPVNEHDAAELAALMDGAREAVLASDAEGFRALFAEAGQTRGQESWDRLGAVKGELGDYIFKRLLTPPELVRATSDTHVENLELKAWFDYSSPQTYTLQTHSTTWSFLRVEETGQWRLDALVVDPTGDEYNPVITDLVLMPEDERLRLGMSSEAAAGSAPQLTRTLQALMDDDIERLKDVTIDGVLFRARDKGVQLQVVENGDTGPGLVIRNRILRSWRHWINHVGWYRHKLKIAPEDALPYFNAYDIILMPEHCTQVGMVISFQDRGVPKDSAGLTVSWEAGYIGDRWLMDYLLVDEIFTYEMTYSFAQE